MANVYTMTGGRSFDTYSGSYNITPTTANITLDTKDKILEGDLTIAGGGQLYNSSIKYGKSIFGVSGTGVELTYSSGVGMAYRNGQYMGDVITKMTQTPNLKSVGEMPEVSDKYSYSFSQSELLVSTFGTRYITMEYDYYASLSTTFRYYNGSTLVSTINIMDIIGDTNVTQVHLDYAVDVTNGNLIMGVITLNSSEQSGFHCCMIQMSDGNYKTRQLLSAGLTSWSSPATPHIHNKYITFVCSDYDGVSSYFAILNSDTLNIKAFKSMPFGVDVYDNCIIGDDDYVYLYATRIGGSSIGGTDIDFVRLNMSGTLISQRSVTQSDLNFTGSSKLPEGYYTALAYFVDSASNVFIFYSSQIYGEVTASGLTYMAKFTSNMSSKVLDQPLTPQTELGGTSESSRFYYDKDTNTMVLYSYNMIIRVSLSGTIYAYRYGNEVLGLLCPYILDSGEVDYILSVWLYGTTVFLETRVYEDKSALKIKTITTSTYTATIEEV